MSDNFLSTQVDGTRIEASHVNQFKEAMTTDLVPRAVSGGATDEAGSLGTDIYRWLRGVISTLFTNKLSIGSTANESGNPSLTKSNDSLLVDVATAKTIDMRVNNSLVGRFNNLGMSAVYLQDLSIAAGKIANNAVTEAKIINSAVTSSKIADSAVTTNKIPSNTISMAKNVTRTLTTGNFTVSNDVYYDRTVGVGHPSGAAFVTGTAATFSTAIPAIIFYEIIAPDNTWRVGTTDDPDDSFAFLPRRRNSGAFIVSANKTIAPKIWRDAGSSGTANITMRLFHIK